MISNLPDDVVHDLLRDLGNMETEDAHTYVKNIIETWEANRDKYLMTVKKHGGVDTWQFLSKEMSDWDADNTGSLPDGSGFIVP